VTRVGRRVRVSGSQIRYRLQVSLNHTPALRSNVEEETVKSDLVDAEDSEFNLQDLLASIKAKGGQHLTVDFVRMNSLPTSSVPRDQPQVTMP
jgi:autonomous glycyl radical cofactor GrcA